jgi:hypothetical protein
MIRQVFRRIAQIAHEHHSRFPDWRDQIENPAISIF